MTRYRKRNLVIAGLCLVVLVMAIGYAAFSSQLNITGTSEISSIWQLEITNIETTKTNGGASNISDPSYTKNSATFNVGLKAPGDYIYYKIEVTNKGTLAAIAKVGKLNCGGNSAIECGAYADSSPTGIGSNTNLEESRLIIGPGEKEYYNVWVKYSNSVTSQPENTSANITLELTYEQSDVGITHKTEDNCYTGKILKNGTMSIVDYDVSCGTDVVIPETIDGYTVTEIADGHWDGTLEKDISAFAQKGITSVVMPDTITSIGYVAFSKNKISSVRLSSNLKAIGSNAFYRNEITSLELPDFLKSIGSQAFGGNELTELEIPSSVTSLGGGAFTNNNFPNDASSFLYKIGANGQVDYTTINSFLGSNLTNIEIPNNVQTIGYRAFWNLKCDSIEIPSNVKRINEGAFEGSGLKSLKLNEGLEVIAGNVFSNNNLTSVNIPNSVTTIDYTAFQNNNLQTVTIGNGIKTIGSNAFKSRASYTGNTTITINKPNGSVSGSPWGASNPTVNWIG